MSVKAFVFTVILSEAVNLPLTLLALNLGLVGVLWLGGVQVTQGAMTRGEIMERGTHEELREKQGFYHHLCMSQLKGQAEVPATIPVA